MRSRTAATAVALVAALVPALSSCSDDPDTPGPSAAPTTAATVEVPPVLEAAWNSGSVDSRLMAYAMPVVVGDVMVVGTDRADRSLSGLDLATGDLAWTTTLPRGTTLCQRAPQGSARGYIGVLLETRGKPCTVVGAVDTRTGELAWTREVEGERPYHEGRSVATGTRTVAATFNCDELRRFRVTDGKPLGIIGPKDRKCAMETATDGHVVLALDDPETAATPDDHGTGWILPHDAAGAFELWDLDSGELRWRRPIETTRGASVDAIISSSGPSTVLAFGEGSKVTMRVVDRRGRLGPYLGRRLGYDQVPTVVGEADGVVVLRYADTAMSSLLFGYDVTTGEELWHVEHVGPAAVVDDGLVLATDTYVEDVEDPLAGQQSWITRVDLRDPTATDAEVTLGSVPGAAPLLLGDRLIAGNTVYALPDTGEERTYEVPPLLTATTWGEDDLTTSDVALACDAVTSQTLALLGLDHPDLPQPSDCTWDDSADPTYLEQDLRVSVRAIAPGRGGASYDEELSGAEMAVQDVQRLIEFVPSYENPLREVDLPGLGDRTWAALPEDPTLLGPSARLVVQWRNLVVDVSGYQETRVDNRRFGAVPDDQVAPAVLAAAADVLRGLGAPADQVVVPPTPTTDAVVAPVCQTLRDEAASLVPGIRPSDQTPRGDGSTGPSRQSACVWWAPDEVEDAPDLGAMVHVVPASPFGATAEEEARELLPGGFARTRPVDGLPGVRARFYRYAGKDGYRSVSIYAIKGDTIVVADHTVPTGGLTRAEGDRIIVRVARQLFASVRR